MKSDYPNQAPAPEEKGEGGQTSMPTVEGRYNILDPYRNPYLTRAWDCSELTLPALLPRQGHNSTMQLVTPFQSVGARGVNNLAAKLLMALFPNAPFFKLEMDEMIVREMENKYGAESKEVQNLLTEFDKALSSIERMVMKDVNISGDRTVLFEALKHLIVTGNVLLHQAKEGLRSFPLNQFVVRRDPAGNVLEIILKEEIDPIVLPLAIQAKIKADKKYASNKSVQLWTYIGRRSDKWVTYQESCGEIIESTRGTYPLDRCPWIPLRFNRINGEDYGRGYVEEYIGDFTSLENLTAAIVQGSAAASKVLFLVKPGGSTKVSVLAKTPNGGFATGNAEEVTVLRLDKAQDFATAKALRDDFIQQLSYAFLLHTAIQRDAERVTAEEIRYMAEELEQTLGGFYSIMSIELQLPYIRVKMDSLSRKGRLPRLPKGAVTPAIVTGLQALGRGNDRNNLLQFLGAIQQSVGPEVAARYVNYGEAIKRLGTSFGIDMKGLIKDEQEMAAEQQQQQMMGMVESLGPQAISALGGAAKERIKLDGQQAQQQAGAGEAPAGAA